MVYRNYIGLGPPDACVRVFNDLGAYAEALLELQRECPRGEPDHMAMGIAIDGLRTAAHHFTRRRDFYHPIEEALRARPAGGNGLLRDRAEALAAFQALTPHVDALRELQRKCPPYGRDWLALDIAKQSLESAAFHFTQEASFYGAQGDSAGPVRAAF